MEVQERYSETLFTITLPKFSEYGPEEQLMSVEKKVILNGINGTLRITLQLFASKNMNGCAKYDERPCDTRSPRHFKREEFTRDGIENIIYGHDATLGVLGSPLNTIKVTSNLGTSPCRVSPKTYDNDDMYDVVVEVEFADINIPLNILQKAQISCGITGRLEFQKELRSQGLNTWRGRLIPRISLKSHNLLKNDTLNAYIGLKFPRDLIQLIPENSLVSLQNDMKKLLLDESSSDAVLLTSDGGKCFCHLSLIKTRSSMLSSCKILNDNDIGILVNGRSPTVTQRVGNRTTPTKMDSNRFVPQLSSSGVGTSTSDSSDTENNSYDLRSPTKSKILSPLKARYRQRTSPRKVLLRREIYKDGEENIIRSPNKSKKDLNECFIDTLSTTNEVPDESLSSSTGTEDKHDKYLAHLERHLKSLKLDKEAVIDDYKVHIKVNMSTSVTMALLNWIYTGDTPLLSRLSKPLLAAGKRYGVPTLVLAAETHLASTLNCKNAISTLVLAHTYKASILTERSLEFISSEAETITHGEEWEETVEKYPSLGVQLTRRIARA